jgi:EmrB/QacA subfamily drug resistance transporter
MTATAMRPIAEMGTRTKVLVMAGTLLGLFTAAMDQTVVATSMPRVIADLGGFGLFAWVGTAFMLASTTTVPIVGKLSDLYGRKPFFMLGIALLLLGSALCGMSQSVEQLIAFRIVQGFGAGMIMAVAFAVVGDVFPPSERGRWMGLMSGVFAAASVVGPLIGGTLTDHANWRWVFYINIPLGLLALAVISIGMPLIRPEGKAKVDYLGAALLCAWVVPMLLAFSWAGDRYPWLSPEVIGFFVWSGLALAAFVYRELHTEEPILSMSLFGNRVFTVSAIVTLITGFAMMGSLFYIPLFVQGVIGSSATNSGLVTMPMMIAMAIASAVSGQVMSRLGRYKALGIIGLLIMVAGMFVLSTMTVNSTRQDVTQAMIIFGVGLGMSMPIFMLSVQNAVPYRVMGSATSTMQFLRSVGGTMGIAVMFTIIQSTYHSSLDEMTPAPVQEQPQLSQALEDPQFLLNARALEQVQGAFQQFGEGGQELFALTMTAVRTSLADGITDAFFVSAFILMAAVVAAAFMKEVPLRKTHAVEEPVSRPAADGSGASPAAVPVLRSIEGGAGDVTSATPPAGAS